MFLVEGKGVQAHRPNKKNRKTIDRRMYWSDIVIYPLKLKAFGKCTFIKVNSIMPKGLKHAVSRMIMLILNGFGIIADTNHRAHYPTTKKNDLRIFGNAVDFHSAKFGSVVVVSTSDNHFLRGRCGSCPHPNSLHCSHHFGGAVAHIQRDD